MGGRSFEPLLDLDIVTLEAIANSDQFAATGPAPLPSKRDGVKVQTLTHVYWFECGGAGETSE